MSTQDPSNPPNEPLEEYIRETVRDELSVTDRDGKRWSLHRLLSIGLTRRQALVALGAIGAGMASTEAIRQALSEAVQPAEASHGSGTGNVGEAGNPINTAFVEHIDGDGSNVIFDNPLETPETIYTGTAIGSHKVIYQADVDSDRQLSRAVVPTDGVSTSATAIFNGDTVISNGTITALLSVSGVDASAPSTTFNDLIHFTRGAGTTTISSTTAGSPAGRTYSKSANPEVSLAMASGTYNITVVADAVRLV